MELMKYAKSERLKYLICLHLGKYLDLAYMQCAFGSYK